jgi:hypothetical protein
MQRGFAGLGGVAVFGSLRGLIHPVVSFPARSRGCYVTPLEQVRTCFYACRDLRVERVLALPTVMFHSQCAELQWSGRKKIL